MDGPSIDGAIVVIVSTAGQGEFPGNAKKFWKQLALKTLPFLEEVRYGVFGLGDSHYWPKEQIYFCKSSRDIDTKLEELGGHRLIDIGLGDDHDDGKYEKQWRLWNPKFWESLGWENDGQAKDNLEQVRRGLIT